MEILYTYYMATFSFLQGLAMVSGIYVVASVCLAAVFLFSSKRKTYRLTRQEMLDLGVEWGIKGSIITMLLFSVLYLFQYEGSDVWSATIFSTMLGGILVYVLTELLLYALHAMCHNVGALWIFHKKHHSIEVFSFTNSITDSFVFQAMSALLFLVATFLLQAPIASLLIAYVAWRIVLALSHLDSPLSYGALGYVFLDPKTHQRHHFEQGNQEYAVTFRCLDYLVALLR